MSYSERFAAEIEAFLAESGMNATAFGRAALNDPSFVGDLKKGRKPNLGIVDRVHAFIEGERKRLSQDVQS
jgi:2,4-dienoyl-CoA reductase-like NADH-dependent reductase (Old Yellow Enzyme family)